MATISLNSVDKPEMMSYQNGYQVELPNEVIIHIMGYLPLSDRIVAGQVCHAWYEASRDLKFLKKEVLKLQGNFRRILNVLGNSCQSRFLNFVFSELDLTCNIDAFCDRHCPEMRSLCINNCDITEKYFVDILKRCSNLQSLSVISCRELLMSGRLLELESDILVLSKTLVKLKELHLGSNRYLSDALFNRFVAIAPNLKELSFYNSQIAFHSGLYKKFYPSKVSASGTILPSESILTFHNILQYINFQAQKIKNLGFGGTLMDNTAINKLVEVPGLQLESLHLYSCDQLTHKGILGITEHQKTLKVLDVSMCSRVVDLSLLSICDSLYNLHSLNISQCRALTNASVSQLWKLKHLENIDLSYCDAVTSPGIEAGLCSRVNECLRNLRLVGLSLAEETVCKLAEHLPNLVSLDLSWCGSAVTDRAIQAICCNLIWLRTLKLQSCDKITDSGLTGMGIGTTSATQLTENGHEDNKPILADQPRLQEQLKLVPVPEQNQGCKISLRSRAEQDIVNDAKRKQMVSQMCEEQYLNLAESGQSLARLKGLRDLDLCGCNRITDVSLKYALHFNELQVLNISHCQQVTHSGLSFVTANNTGIEKLFMSHCYNVTDDGIENVVKSLPRLKFLDLQHCVQLTDRSLIAMGQHSRSLRHLDVSHCVGMSLEECDRVESSLPSLHTFHHHGIVSRCVPLFGVNPTVPKPPSPRRGLRSLWRH